MQIDRALEPIGLNTDGDLQRYKLGVRRRGVQSVLGGSGDSINGQS